jgi:hypothetical protein
MITLEGYFSKQHKMSLKIGRCSVVAVVANFTYVRRDGNSARKIPPKNTGESKLNKLVSFVPVLLIGNS